MPEAQMSKAVKNRYDSGEYVASSARANAAIGDGIESRFGLGGGMVAGFARRLFGWLTGVLAAAGARMKEAELAYVAELADDVEPRRRRDERATTAWELMASARSRIEAVLGDDGLRRYGLWEPVPQVPGDLSHRMTTTVDLLERHPVRVDDPFGAPLDSAAVVARLKASKTDLDGALATVLDEERERQDALAARDRAIQDWSRTYQGVASILTGLFVLAGRDDLGERLRPTARRAAGLDAPPEEAPAEPAAPEGGTPPPSA